MKMKNYMSFEKVIEFVTINLISWVYSPLDLFLSNFAKLLWKQKAAEEYLIWLHNAN
jgi:hypothetical protein